MDNKDLLKNFFDAVIGGKDDAESYFKQYTINKTKDIVTDIKQKSLRESIFMEIAGMDSPIRLHGDDVLIDNKLVGHVTADLDDFNSGIKFTSVDGRVSEEFDDIESLYDYLSRKFGLTESVIKSLEMSNDLDLSKLGDINTGVKPDDTSSDGSSSPRLNKIKGLISTIKSGNRKTSTKG